MAGPTDPRVPPAVGLAVAVAAISAGAVAAAGYVLAGRSLRQRVALVPYVVVVCGVCAVVLLGVALARGAPLTGYHARERLLFAGLAVGPGLLGHTLVNWTLAHVESSVASVSLLGEPVGATLLALVVVSEAPSSVAPSSSAASRSRRPAGRGDRPGGSAGSNGYGPVGVFGPISPVCSLDRVLPAEQIRDHEHDDSGSRHAVRRSVVEAHGDSGLPRTRSALDSSPWYAAASVSSRHDPHVPDTSFPETPRLDEGAHFRGHRWTQALPTGGRSQFSVAGSGLVTVGTASPPSRPSRTTSSLPLPTSAGTSAPLLFLYLTYRGSSHSTVCGPAIVGLPPAVADAGYPVPR